MEYTDYKLYERGLNVVGVDARRTSITCSICGWIWYREEQGEQEDV
uniref:Cas12f1-like TNB domain-containing protein n=1 Tax=Ignisphaera aggregans TaxID=334771 RepID=A0A7J3Z811_9CREN